MTVIGRRKATVSENGPSPVDMDRSWVPEDGGEPSPLIVRLCEGRTPVPLTVLGWVLFAAGVGLLIGQFWGGINPQDEGEMIVYPWLVARGWAPYVRIWTMYPPASFLLLAGMAKLGLPGLVAERAVGFVARLACVLLFNRAATGSWRRCSWVVLPLSFSLLFITANISLAAYAWIDGLPFLIGGLLAVRSQRTVLAALLFFAAGTFRIEFATAGILALAMLAFLPVVTGRVRPKTSEPLFVLVAALVFFYVVLHLLTGGLALGDILVDPILRIEPLRRLPLFPPDFGLFGVPAALVLFLGPPLLVLYGLVHRLPTLAATNAAVCLLLPQVLQVADWGHLFAVAAFGVPWVALSVADLFHRHSSTPSNSTALASGPRVVPRSAAARALWMTAVCGYLYALFVALYGLAASPLSPAAPAFIGNHPGLLVGNGVNTVIARTTREATDERQVIAFVLRHQRPGDTLFIAPSSVRRMEYNFTVLYYGLGLTPAGMYLEADPGFTTQDSVQRAIVRDLRRCRWVILWKDPVGARERPLAGTLLERDLRTRYRPVLENHTFEVRERF